VACLQLIEQYDKAAWEYAEQVTELLLDEAWVRAQHAEEARVLGHEVHRS
jgi:hypothetical protein